MNPSSRIQRCPFETQDYRSRQYGDARIDRYVTEPAGGVNRQTGLMLLIHGWGNDGQAAYAEESLLYADQFNLVVTRVEFRDCGREAQHPSPGMTYDQPYDFSKLQAIDCLRAAYATLAQYPHLDRSRLIIWGGSQGGHLGAQCLIFAPHLWALAILTCGISIPLTSAQLRAWGFGFELRTNKDGWGFVECALGATHATLPPAEEDIRSPYRNAALISPHTPIHLIHGTHDDCVDIKHTVFFYARLLGLNRPVRFHAIDGGDHSLQTAHCPELNSRYKATLKYAGDDLLNARRSNVDLFPTDPTLIPVRGGQYAIHFPSTGPELRWTPST